MKWKADEKQMLAHYLLDYFLNSTEQLLERKQLAVTYIAKWSNLKLVPSKICGLLWSNFKKYSIINKIFLLKFIKKLFKPLVLIQNILH